MKSPGLAACSERIRAAKGTPVTANELLALLGRAWSRLLIYPGGLAAFGIVWLISILQNRVPSLPALLPTAGEGSSAFPSPAVGRGVPQQRRGEGIRIEQCYPVLSSWFGRPALACAGAAAAAAGGRAATADRYRRRSSAAGVAEPAGDRQELRAAGMRRLAAALNSYPPLILATLALAQAGNSLELAALARAPGNLAATSTSALHWLGAVALALALPPALGIGPFAANKDKDDDDTTTDDRTTRFATKLLPNPHP